MGGFIHPVTSTNDLHLHNLSP